MTLNTTIKYEEKRRKYHYANAITTTSPICSIILCFSNPQDNQHHFQGLLLHMFESFLFMVFIISFAIYLISTKVRQYPQNQGDPNIRLRKIESICDIINIASFAIFLSSFFLSTLRVPEIIIRGIDIFAICTFTFSFCCILLMQKLIQKLPIDETDNTFRSRLRLWSQDTLKMFSKKVHSIISAGKKRVAPQQQSTEEHSVVTDSNTKIKNNDETSNIFIAIIFIVTLFLFITTLYATYTTGKEIQRTILDNFFGLLCNAYASSWIVNTAVTIVILYMVSKWQGWQFHPLTAANHIAAWGGIGGAFGLIISGLSMFSAGNLVPSANISSLCTPNTFIDATTIGALIGSVLALPSYSFSCFSKDTPIWTKLSAPLIQSVTSLAAMPYISPSIFLQKVISYSSSDRSVSQLKAQAESVTSESQVAALINKDWRLILIAADQEEFKQCFSNVIYITVTLMVMTIPIVIILRKQFSIVMEKSN